MRYMLATANPGKVKEIRELLSGTGIEIVTREDCGIDIDVEETGMTFFENAKLKAEAICTASGMPSIADDSGLIVDALSGEPGVYTSSFGGEELTAGERCVFLLNKMGNTEHRSAKFVCTIVCAFPDGSLLSADGECHGTIAAGLHGTGGFGYDPVFIPDGKTATMAELLPDEKNEISHRGKALRSFLELLKSRCQI